MDLNLGAFPGAKNMTGSRAFSAAGQNQSATPLSSSALCARCNVSRTPSIPGCSLHFGRSAADSGFSNGMRPMTAKRPG